jgi:hypothetical protein
VERKFLEDCGASGLRYRKADIRGATALPSTGVSLASAHHGKNSSGANLLAGLELGRVLRKVGASTNIGKRVEGVKGIRPAECMSACALSYLGGTYRYLLKESS